MRALPERLSKKWAHFKHIFKHFGVDDDSFLFVFPIRTIVALILLQKPTHKTCTSILTQKTYRHTHTYNELTQLICMNNWHFNICVALIPLPGKYGACSREKQKYETVTVAIGGDPGGTGGGGTCPPSNYSGGDRPPPRFLKAWKISIHIFAF